MYIAKESCRMLSKFPFFSTETDTRPLFSPAARCGLGKDSAKSTILSHLKRFNCHNFADILFLLENKVYG